MTPRLFFLVAVLATLVVAAPVSAQSWPARPVRIVVPFAAGGSADSVARITAEWLTQRIGAPFIVENKPGAAGAIAAEHVARSRPDGYTLFLATTPQMAILPAMSKTPYDPVKDFALISIVGNSVFALALNDTIPPKTLTEFVAYARERPNKLAYSSGGMGSVSHLSMALLLQRAGLQVTHVTYKGGAPAFADVIAGHIHLHFGNLADIVPHSKSGKIKVLAVSGERRSSQLPTVPTVAEQGYPGFHTDTWNGLAAPAGTPPPIIEQIAKEVGAGAKDTGFIKKLEGIGFDALGNSPAEFAKVLEADIKTWGEAVRISGAKLE